MIKLSGISKTFKIATRQAGAMAAFKSLFHREYRFVEALRSVSFQVDEGEIVGYIGPNGAGKSTSIKVMSGILVPDVGEADIMGCCPWKDRAEYVKHIGVVFGQRTQLWWDVPVIDSYELLRDIYKVPQAEYKRNLDQLDGALNLSEILNTPLRSLSLGQRMRAEIACSLLHSPKILFLDEPTIGLDAVSKLAVRQFIKDVNRRRQLTVILTTHDMNDIDALTDRVILIGKGTILRDGSMSQLKRDFDSYRTLTVTFSRHEERVGIPHAQIVDWSPERAVYKVDTEKTSVSSVLSQLSQTLDIQDMTSESRPIEEVIARLYQEHGL